MELTENLGIPLPGYDDVVDIEDLNQGFRILDEAVMGDASVVGTVTFVDAEESL